MKKTKHKFAVLGTTTFVLSCAQAILDTGHDICLMVTLQKNLLPLNSADIGKFAKQRHIDCFECVDINNKESIDMLKRYPIDYLFCSWPKILKAEALAIPKHYCICTHPTKLPQNRGRHPLHWLIVLGHEKSALSFFIMDAGIDSGELLLQQPFSLPRNQSIAVAVDNMDKAGYIGTKKLCENILGDSNFIPQAQDQTRANYWRKREPFDCIIDPRMSVTAITRLVRSYALPYPCATLILSDKIILKIQEAHPVHSNDKSSVQNQEPGYIVAIEGKQLIMKADDGLVKMVATDCIPCSDLKLKYVYSPLKYTETVKLIYSANGLKENVAR